MISDYITDNRLLVEMFMNASDDIKRRVIAYYFNINCNRNNEKKDRNISIICDENGKSTVLINDIRYKSRRSIDWNEIETYLKQYVGECFEILETSERVYIGTDFPDEYAHSKDTKDVKGVNKKAKANAITAIEDLIEIASDKAEFPDHNIGLNTNPLENK